MFSSYVNIFPLTHQLSGLPAIRSEIKRVGQQCYAGLACGECMFAETHQGTPLARETTVEQVTQDTVGPL